jgi:hypothetical protein
VAERLDEIAELLQSQGANRFRCEAYRQAAETLRQLREPVHEIIAREGREGLTDLRGIGRSLSRTIETLAESGDVGLLNRLRGDAASEWILSTVAGIGTKTAAMIHEELGIETLAELEAAAWDGRLARLPGMGPKRIQAVRETLAGRFQQRRRTTPTDVVRPTDEPPVAELLEIDREYRQRAAVDQLPRIAPRRFNPTGQAWLPIWHTERGHRHYTALFSNTARAHELGTVRDWVVIYRDDTNGDGQWTVITSRFGRLKGKRIVRGRESESLEHYENQAVQQTLPLGEPR